ncbi:MAG: thermonuclease family protein, partial [Chloroflexi bacterium]|nr:thermonuclease family protein [Chloroflexota bacterium]
MQWSPRRLLSAAALPLGVFLALAVGAPAAAQPSAAPPAPTLTSPDAGARLPGLEAALSWSLPTGTTQEQLQVLPANNDGPGVNLIRNAKGSFTVPPPPTWYVMLPGMSYTWRVRVTDKATFASEDDPAWGPWSEVRTFRTPAPSSEGIVPVAPPNGSQLTAVGPITVQWAHPNPSIFYYEIQVSGDPLFNDNPATAVSFVWSNLVHGGVTNPPNSWRTPALQPTQRYYWRVRPRVQGDGTPVAWGPIFCFGMCSSAAPSVLSPAPAYGAAPGGEPANVADIADGSTVKLWLDGRVQQVRLIGAAAPSLPSAAQPGACFGREAAARASELLEGQRVKAAADPALGAQDGDGKLLAYLWLQDGRLLNELLSARGMRARAAPRRRMRTRGRFRRRSKRRRRRAADSGRRPPATGNSPE